MSLISFAERFDVGALRTRLTGYEGRTPDGDHVIACEDVDHNGDVVARGNRLYFRNNDPADIAIDENSMLAGEFVVSRDGKWITRKGGGINTDGYGVQKVAK